MKVTWIQLVVVVRPRSIAYSPVDAELFFSTKILVRQPSTTDGAGAGDRLPGLHGPVDQKRGLLPKARAGATQLKTPYSYGTTHVIFELQDFIARLAAQEPKPRGNPTMLKV
jgi:hypothetical protein